MHKDLHSVQSTSHLLVSRKRKFSGIHRISVKASFHGETPDFILSNKQAIYCFQFVSVEMTLQCEKGQTLYKTQISKSNALGQDDTVVLMALSLKLKSCMFQSSCCNPSRGKCLKLLQCLHFCVCLVLCLLPYP